MRIPTPLVQAGGGGSGGTTTIIQQGGGSAGVAYYANLGDVSVSSPTDGQIGIYSSALNQWVNRSLLGTANRVSVNVTAGTGVVTLSGPQDIHTGASPTFTGLTLSGLTASRLVLTDGSKNLSSAGYTLAAPAGAGALLYDNGTNYVRSGTGSTSYMLYNNSGIPTWASSIQTDGNWVGVNSVPTTNSNIRIARTFGSAAVASQINIECASVFSNTQTVDNRGISVNTVMSHTSGTIAAAYGLISILNCNGVGGTTTIANGLWSRVDVQTGAVLTEINGLMIETPTGTGAPTVAYGIRIKAQTVGATKWELASDNASGNSYFAGSLSIGKSTAPGAKLDVSGTAIISGRSTIAGISNSATLSGGIATKTTTYSATSSDYFLIGNVGTASFTITLPAANALGAGKSQTLVVRALGSAAGKLLTVQRTGADTITNGATTGATSVVSGAGVAPLTWTFQSDGSSIWYVTALN